MGKTMRAYSFQNTILLINGIEMTNFSDGDDAITITRAVDSTTSKVGADGKMMVSISADRSGSFKFKLQATSPSNKYLTGLLALQEAGPASFVPVTVQFLDTYRNDVAVGTVGYIKNMPEIKRGVSAGDAEWEIVVENLNSLIGDAADLIVGS